MVLVIISVQFGETKKREWGLMAQERRLARAAFSTGSFKSQSTKQSGESAWETLLQSIGRMILVLRVTLLRMCSSEVIFY